MPLPNIAWPEAMVLSCSSMCACICLCVRPCAYPVTMLTQYLAEYLTHLHQTYINDALCDRDEHVTIWGHKVKGQGHGGIKYAGNALSGLANLMS